MAEHHGCDMITYCDAGSVNMAALAGFAAGVSLISGSNIHKTLAFTSEDMVIAVLKELDL